MKLQLALDDLILKDSIALMEKVQNDVDIIEIGTPFMMVYGMEAVRELKKKFPKHEVLCDAKIMDAGAYEAEICFTAGADYVTVLGVTDNATIKACVDKAKVHGKKLVVDMICVDNLPEKIKTLESLGVEYLAVHTGVDQQANGRTPLDDLKEMREASKTAIIAVAGGLKSSNLAPYMPYNPDIIIVGGGILNAPDPVAETKKIKSILNSK
jgi:3-hexulose-6-phosphate synthase